MEKDCLFCKIVAGEIKAELVLETESVLAFYDVNPVCDIHILIIPKRHIDSVLTIKKEDSMDVVEMYSVVKQIVEKKSIGAFRLTVNGGKFQHVGHLHMHLLAGKKIDWNKL
jgi:histidine triad (HIT) family protein